MSARDRILSRLRGAGGRGALPLPVVAVPANAEPVDARLQRLAAGLEAAHAEVIRLPGAEVGRRLADFCARRSLRRLMLPAAGLPFAPPVSDACVVERFDRPIEDLKRHLFDEVDAGLTVADCAIAETGTLVLRSSPDQPRTLSLVPPIHLCLIDASRVHPTLGAALVAEGWAGGLPTNLIFVSGPSKTADIQQTLAYGAHGPKELVVFLHEGPAA